MTIRLSLLALLLLAACSERRPAADAASTDKPRAPAVDSSPAHPVAEDEPGMPDAGDPRLFLSLDSLRWAQWETRRPADPEARLRELGIQPIRADSVMEFDPADGYDPNGERVRDFHFVDFSGDGVEDVIYDGAWFMRNDEGQFGAGEGSRLKMYQVMGGRAVLVMEHHASIQRVWKGRPDEPVSFRTLHHGCCADPEWSVEYHRPVRRGDTVRFEARHRVMGREGLVIPTTFMGRPRRFTVGNDRYLLRDAPGIDTETADGDDWYRWEGRGNALAEYGRGARGTAIAEQTDSTGRVWWFVRMDGGTPPREAQTAAPYDPAGREMSVDRLGWMSSRFLQAEP